MMPIYGKTHTHGITERTKVVLHKAIKIISQKLPASDSRRYLPYELPIILYFQEFFTINFQDG